VNNESSEELILVDDSDNSIGFETKLKAHENGGRLHRAFTIFVLNSAGRMLLQRRAKGKYHFSGLWSNACCSHPRKGETLQDAAHRRLQQEFGFDAGLREIFSFVYRASDPRSGLAEHEFDHVFCGEFDGEPRPNPDEIKDWKWICVAELLRDLQSNPHDYTPWFRIAVPRVIKELPPLDEDLSASGK
jgi:isopentenyl-diphosphate delta-isomerase